MDSNNVPQIIWSLKISNDGNIDILYRNTYCLQYNSNFSIFDPQIIHPDDLEHTLLTWKNAVDGNQPFVVKHRLKNQNQYNWFLTHAKSNKNNSDIWYGICTDITEFIIEAQESKKTRVDLSKHARVLADDAIIAEEVRVDLSKHAQVLADNAVTAEEKRVALSEQAEILAIKALDLIDHAKILAVEASDAEETRVDLSIHAELLEQQALELVRKALSAEESRLKLSEKADVAETTRLNLSEYAKILAKEAKIGEQSRINLSEEIVKRTIAEQQLRIILNTLPIIIWVVNMNGVFTMSEGKGLNELGMSSDMLLGTSCYDFFPVSEHVFINDSFQTTKLTERQVKIRNKLYNIFYCPLKFDVGIIGVVILAQDISKQKLLEEQKSALILREEIAKNEVDVKSKFLANISHEMRTPLYGIMANIEFLLESKLNETQIDNANIAYQSVISISKVINDILDITMLEQKEIILEKYKFPLYDTLKNCILLFKPSAIIKGLDYYFTIDHDIPQTVIGDPNRVIQLLSNLINNAIKFTENGYIEINVLYEEKSLNKMAAVVINITDTGIGMLETSKNNVFKDFYQADSSTTRPYGGIGMGINISHKLANLMHGDIKIKSNVHSGSTFSIKLKFERVVVEQLPNKIIENKQLLLNIKILLNEDNIINQKIVQKVLRDAGAIVICVDNALIGFQRWKENKNYFDVILMDCYMPVLDGYDGTKLLRNEGCTLPIIALTANALQENLNKCISVGMNDYITKPAKPKVLIQKIKEWTTQLY